MALYLGSQRLGITIPLASDSNNSQIELPALVNEGTPDDLHVGKQLIDSSGNIVEGNFSLDTELSDQKSLIEQISAALEGKTAGGSTAVLQTMSVVPTTSPQTFTPEEGYDGFSEFTVESIPSTFVEPTATKGATTYTPGTTSQTIPVGTYCSGVQTIKGDANLKSSNIRTGVSIFGITGTYSGSGGTDVSNSTVTVNLSSSSINATIHYTNKNLAYSTYMVTSPTLKLTVATNTLIYVASTANLTVSGSYQYITNLSTGYVILIKGNATLTIGGNSSLA